MSIDYSKLQRDPQVFLDLLKSTLVVTNGLPKSKHGKPQKLTLTPHGNTVVGRGDGTSEKMTLCTLAEKGRFSRKWFSAYICDYEENETSYQMLGDAARYCFTLPMNGCTFGIGSTSAEGYVLVSHCNAKFVGAYGDQSEFQREVVQSIHPEGSILGPGAYQAVGRVATTFGIRGEQGWEFHYQSWNQAGRAFDCYGVRPVGRTSFRY